MSSRNKNRFTIEQLESRGFSMDANGTYSKQMGRVDIGPAQDHPLIVKEVIKPHNGFEAKPTTEWFIKNYNVPSKKNSRQNFVRNGKQISIPSKQHAEYVKMTAMQYATFGIEFRAAVECHKLCYPLYIEFTFVRSSHRRWDFCNAAQTCEDLMVKNKWLRDDDSTSLVPVFALPEYDKNCPGVRIKLLLK